jgi:hypothetical protein
MTPTALTLRLLRLACFTAEPVERFIAGAGEHGQGIRRDWGHFADVLACHPVRKEILLVQASTLGNVSARLNKARGRPELRQWLSAGGLFEVHGWVKREGRWRCKQVAIELRDLGELAAVVVSQPPRKKRRSRWQPGELFDGLVDF